MFSFRLSAALLLATALPLFSQDGTRLGNVTSTASVATNDNVIVIKDPTTQKAVRQIPFYLLFDSFGLPTAVTNDSTGTPILSETDYSWTFRSLVAGTNIAFGLTNQAITIHSTGPGSSGSGVSGLTATRIPYAQDSTTLVDSPYFTLTPSDDSGILRITRESSGKQSQLNGIYIDDTGATAYGTNMYGGYENQIVVVSTNAVMSLYGDTSEGGHFSSYRLIGTTNSTTVSWAHDFIGANDGWVRLLTGTNLDVSANISDIDGRANASLWQKSPAGGVEQEGPNPYIRLTDSDGTQGFYWLVAADTTGLGVAADDTYGSTHNYFLARPGSGTNMTELEFRANRYEFQAPGALVGDGTGLTLDVDNATAGTLAHERGGLEADVSAYSGLAGINAGATVEVDTIAEFDTMLGLTGTADGTTFLRGDGAWATPAGSGDVTAASAFGTDNVLIRSDGVNKGVQSSGITIDDSDHISGATSVRGASIVDAVSINRTPTAHGSVSTTVTMTTNSYQTFTGTDADIAITLPTVPTGWSGLIDMVNTHTDGADQVVTFSSSVIRPGLGSTTTLTNTVNNGTTLIGLVYDGTNWKATATGDDWDGNSTGAPTDADYLVGTANAGLSAEIVAGTGVTTWFQTPSSANLRGALTDESGTGAALFAGGDIGAATATTPSANDNDTSVATTAFVQSEAPDEIYIDAGAFIPNTTSGAASATTELATNDIMEDTMDFDAAADEFIGAWIMLPADYGGGTVAVTVYWTASGGSAGDVVWGAGLRSFGDDDPRDAAVAINDTVTDSWIANGDEHISTAMTTMTIQGTPAAGERVYLKISRDADNASDTFASDAKFLGARFQY